MITQKLNYDIMKNRTLKLIVSFILIMFVSCEEPVTVVTNYVHTDGTVTREVEMRSDKKKFKLSDIQVPIDSTWTIKDSCEINVKGDTTWVRRAVKLFKNVAEINLTYKNDSSGNKEVYRQSGFEKRFRWFNTEYRFSERIDKKLPFGYPIKDFLNKEELMYFYSPENVKMEKEKGVDSLKYRTLSDSINRKTDNWAYKNLVSMWIGEFARLTEGKSGNDLAIDSLKAHEDEYVSLVRSNEQNFDTQWTNGFFLKKFIGEANALKYKSEADTAFSIVTTKFFIDFKDYSVRIVMPGKLIGTNGFADSSEMLIWPVRSEFFLSEPYEMWAESKIPNTWAWMVSVFFLVFVLTGVILRIIKKG
jgi:hypothetical protein